MFLKQIINQLDKIKKEVLFKTHISLTDGISEMKKSQKHNVQDLDVMTMYNVTQCIHGIKVFQHYRNLSQSNPR